VTGIVDRLVSDDLAARAQRNGDRRTSFIRLTRKGCLLFADMAAAHESWVDELLGGLSVRDAEQMSAKLKSFRSDWEGEAGPNHWRRCGPRIFSGAWTAPSP